MRHIYTTLAISLFILSSCEMPAEEPQQNWYKGNLHTHSYWSDGDDFPERIMDWYKSRDYNFLALTEHNIFAEGEKWINLRQGELHQKAFNEYLETYGTNWIKHEVSGDTTKVLLKTFEEYAPIFEEDGRFLVLRSEEITDRFEEHHAHLNATNVQEVIQPQGGNSMVEVLQNNIDAVTAQRDSTGEPIMVHINHPNFFYSISVDDMIQLSGERFFEVYNGHHRVNNEGDSTHVSTEVMWDLINIAYLADGKPLIYGLATDDTHNYHETGREWSNAGRGWVQVNADSLSTGALIEAMEAGHFYSSTGVELSHLSFDEGVLRLEVAQESGVEYEIKLVGVRDGSSAIDVISEEPGSSLEFEVGADWQFVRAKITSSKAHENPVAENEMEVAWTQPVRPGI